MKRFIAIIMTLCLVLGVSSVSAWADEAKWETEMMMPTSPDYFGVCSIENNIYVLGGNRDNLVSVYDIKAGTWRMGPSMPEKSIETKAVAIGKKIYAISRFDKSYMQIYDSVKNTWTAKEMPFGFSLGSGFVAIGEKIYLVCQGTVSIYDTVSEQWTSSKSTAKYKKIRCGICTQGNNIYVMGGTLVSYSGEAATNTAEVYNTDTDTWKSINDMPIASQQLTSTTVGNSIYALGGLNSNRDRISSVQIYDIGTNSWSKGISLKTPILDAKSIAANGKLFLIGGNDGNGFGNRVESLKVGKPSDDLAAKLSVLLNEGENIQLSTSYNLDNNKNFTWSSANEAVAKVDVNGKVTAIAEGTADIYAQNADGTFKEYIPVKVVKGVADELRLAVHLKIGEKANLYLIDDASKVTWTSMDSSIATVAADGQVTGVKKGLAIVKAEMDGQSYQIYVRVNG